MAKMMTEAMTADTAGKGGKMAIRKKEGKLAPGKKGAAKLAFLKKMKKK